MEFIFVYSVVVTLIFLVWLVFVARMYNKMDE